ncbi:MAG: aminotransferase class I/II-fold pyridoxal phosphate-dependent enzyme [Clostridia bacterium]|nr:aminotransferase class I/II-fold pyridoxal phosphate-dependent enzyme [Clostridia bacterium]
MKKNIDCKIQRMLDSQKKHISFHTPGHKRAGADITELSYSDNLYSPSGVIARAERDVAEILGANRSFLLTDGSTSGVYAMFAAVKKAGATRIAAPAYSHVCVKNACEVLGLEIIEIPEVIRDGIPQQPSTGDIETALNFADALLLTSPDYYGNVAPLQEAKSICVRADKPFLVDGAHGSHLHFTREHAGRYADMWVDGVHKSLPALTQGAVVSAASAVWAERLAKSVRLFRTTSPSYPILASVEYAVKYPRNEQLEQTATVLKRALGAYPNGDWSKLVIPFGKHADEAQTYLEKHGVYAEFNDGNYLMFYLSPATTLKELEKLCKLLEKLPREEVFLGTVKTKGHGKKQTVTTWLPLKEAIGRTCAEDAGLFPPCMPLVKKGEIITERIASRLMLASSTYGLQDGKIAVVEEE